MNKLSLGVALVALLVAIGGYFYPQHAQQVGTILDTSNFDWFQATTNGGFKVGSNTIINGSGNISQPTSNSATSSATVGCIQMYATSTATAIHFEISTTTSLATYSGGSIPNGGVSWRYGSCPV